MAFSGALEASKSDLSYNPQAPSSGQKTKINLYHSTPAPYPGQGSYTTQKDLRQEQSDIQNPAMQHLCDPV